MTYEDFTSPNYTEIDDEDDITVTTNKIDVDTMERSTTGIVYKNFGEDFFEDFEHFYDLYVGTSTGQDSVAGFWALNNSAIGLDPMNDADTGMSAYLYEGGTSVRRIYIKDYSNDEFDNYTVSPTTQYYLILKRVDTTFTCAIYLSAEDRALEQNEEDILTIDCAATKYSHMLAVVSMDRAGSQSWTFYTENLDIQYVGEESQECTETFTATDTLSKYPQRTYDVVITLTDVHSLMRGKTLEEINTLTDLYSGLVSKSLGEVVTLTDGCLKATSIVLSEAGQHVEVADAGF